MNEQEERPQLGRIGIWATELRFADPAFIAKAASDLEGFGYGALWFPGGRGGNLLETIDRLLDATDSVAICTGILNIWMHDPAEVGTWWRGLSAQRRARIMLGLGVGHAPVIGDAWKKPLHKMADYLDGLDREGVPRSNRCVAVLGPKMLDLSASRSAGAHPYLVTPEHTALARERMGTQALLAAEQGVVLETDPQAAREKARGHLHHYSQLPNYRNNWQRLGFTVEEIDGLADRLVDGLVAWGDVDRIAERVAAHFAAGADHVCMQVIGGAVGTASDPEVLLSAWADLAPARLGA